MKGYIYGLKCPIRDEIVYIGQTHNSILIRLTKHISLTKTKIKYNKVLSKKEHWIKKLIQLNREKEIVAILIEECELSEIDNREIFWISQYSKYDYMKNLAIGGRVNRGYKRTIENKLKISEGRKGKCVGVDNKMYNKEYSDLERINLSNKLKYYYLTNIPPMLNKKHSDETKSKISENRIGKNIGLEHFNYGKKLGLEKWFRLTDISKNNNPNIGKKHKDETKEKISLANSGEKNGMYGKTYDMSNEHKNKISETLRNSDKLKESRNSEEYKRKISENFSIPLLVLDKDFNIIYEFKNCRECSEFFNFTNGNVANAVRFKRRLSRKYWVVRKEGYLDTIEEIKCSFSN